MFQTRAFQPRTWVVGCFGKQDSGVSCSNSLAQFWFVVSQQVSHHAHSTEQEGRWMGRVKP